MKTTTHTKKVLVTGGAGFLGKEVTKQLQRKGYTIIIADRKSKEFAPKCKCTYLQYNLTDKKLARQAMKGIDYCLHLANESGGIGFTRRFPATILSENNKINSSVLEAAAEENIKRIVFISSSMVFETAKAFPVTEDSIFRIKTPQTGYAFSKLMGERLCASFWDEYGLEYAICRPANIYGIGSFMNKEEGFSHVIPDLSKKILSHQYPLEIFGTGLQSRCFTHVSDIADGVIRAMEIPEAMNQTFNLSSREETRVIELAEKLFTICRIDKPFEVKRIKGFPDDVQRNFMSSRKAKKILGWEAQKKLDDELPKIVNWVKRTLLVSE